MLPFALRPDSTRANLVWATTPQAIENLSGYSVLAVLTRTLVSADLGRMFLAATVSGIAPALVSVGSEHHLVRAVATQRDSTLQNLGDVLAMRLQNMLPVYLSINLLFWILQPELTPVLLLVSAYDFLEELWYAFSAFFTGVKKLRYRLAIVAFARSAEVLIDGPTGLVVPNHDVQAFSKAIIDLLDDPERARQLGRAARSHVQEFFVWEPAVVALEKTYAGLERPNSA